MGSTGTVVVVGGANADLITRVPRLTEPGETVLATDAYVLPGGKGANQAVACARAGAATTFVGCVGDDDDGRLLTVSLTAAGVDQTHLARTGAARTGQALIQVADDGDNMIVVVSAANAHVAQAQVDDALGGVPDVLLAQLELAPRLIEGALLAAAARGTTTVLNAAPVTPEARALSAQCHVLVVNEREAAALAQEQFGADLELLVAALLARGPQGVVVTLGARGVAVHDGTSLTHLAAHPCEVVDTTGAGDAFCGGLAAGLARGDRLVQAAELGLAMAARAVATSGAQVPA